VLLCSRSYSSSHEPRGRDRDASQLRSIFEASGAFSGRVDSLCAVHRRGAEDAEADAERKW